MPNWCVGDLKVRGKVPNVESFFKQALPAFKVSVKQYDRGGHGIDWQISESYKDESPFFCKYCIQGTRRQITQESCGDAYTDNDVITLILAGLECAWTFDVDGFKELSKIHGVDFKFYGFERGMQFNQEVEIIQGELTVYKEHKFNDYAWECIHPTLGG